MVLDANLRLLLNVVDRVCLRRLAPGGHLDAGNLPVQVVVGKNHAAVDVAALVRSVHVAVEKIGLGRAEGRLDVEIPLGDDVVDFVKVGLDV